MMGYGFGYGGGIGAVGGVGGLLGGLGGLLVLAGLVVLVIWAVSRLTRPGRDVAPGLAQPDPLETLRTRFARGEITETEFVEAKRVLGYDR